MAAILLAAAVLLPLLRQRGTPSWETVWSEDASIYTYQAVWHGSLDSLFRGYAGYLQLPPRLMAVPTPYFSLRYLSVYDALISTVTGALLAWSTYALSRGWLRSRLLQLTLATLVVLMPALGIESTATMTNTVWMFLAVLPWALISLEERARDTVLRSALAFLGATASALSVLFVPLALGWLVYRRSRSALIVVGTFFVGLAVQGAVYLSTTQSPKAVDSPSIFRDGISVRVFGEFLFGTRWEQDWWRADWKSLVVVGPLLTLVLLVLLAIGAERRAQVMAGALALLAVLVFAVPAWGRGTWYLRLVPGHMDGWIESRFSVVPVMLLVSSCAILIASPGGSRRRAVRRFGPPVLAAWMAILVAVCFSVSIYRGTDPSWTSRVDAVLAAECAGRAGSTIVTIPNEIGQELPYPKIPGGYFPLTVRCSNLK